MQVEFFDSAENKDNFLGVQKFWSVIAGKRFHMSVAVKHKRVHVYWSWTNPNVKHSLIDCE